jgi:hypothetical protein
MAPAALTQLKTRPEVLLRAIQGTFDAACGVAKDMRVDHGR